jgi:plastocyanin
MTMQRFPRTLRPALLAVAVLSIGLATVACGGGSSSSSSPGSQPAGGGTTINVDEKEYSISLAGGTKLAPGAYTFQVKNSGKTTHDLAINGPGVSNQKTSTIAAGSSATLSVTLQKGTYDFYCSIDSHKQLGMDVTVNVA